MNGRTLSTGLALAPLRKQSVVFLAIFTVALPLLVLTAMLVFPDQRQSPVAGIVTVVTVLVIAGLLVAATRRRLVTIEDGRLVLRATIYTRRIALDEIDLANARVLDLREHPKRRPFLKTNGLAVPGLAAGSFRDRRRNRLFCLVTAPRVVALPLADGSRVLISPEHPESFLEALRQRD